MTHHRTSQRPRVAIAFVLLPVGVWLLGQPAPASAQQGWSGVVDSLSLPSSSTVPTPDLAVDAAGNATVVWTQFAGVRLVAVQVARFTHATGTWTAPSTLSAPGEFTSGPRVAMDAAGNALVVWARSDVVQAARYSAAGGTWSAPVDLSVPGQPASVPSVAMDPAGNGVAVWGRGDHYGAQIVQAARYTAATSSWGEPVDLLTTAGFQPSPRVAMDPAGDAIAVFIGSGVVHARRYSMLGDTWGSAVAISTAGQTASFLQLDVDAQGNAMAAWIQEDTGAFGVVHAARFVRASEAWAVPTALSLGSSTSPAIAVDTAGNAIVTWLRNNPSPLLDVETARYSVAGDSWGAVERLAAGQNLYTGAPVAVDDTGNAIAVWSHGIIGPRLQFARFVAAAGVWSVAEDVAPIVVGAHDPDMQFDGSGNAFAIWTRFTGGFVQEAARWLATPGATTITGVEPAPGTLAVHVVAPVTTEPDLAPTNYEYSIDNGATYAPRDPASLTSPVVIGGLTDFTSYTLRIRAINAAGAGVASAPVAAIAGPVPGPPIGLTATAIAGNTVTIQWTAPPSGVVPATGYVLEGGINPGEVLASIPTGILAPTFRFVAPTGAFYIRVHAVAGAVRSAPSNEIRIFVNVPAAPSAPANLLGLVNGSSVALSWVNTFGGGTPTSLWLNVTGAITTALPLPFGEAFTLAGVPPGTYTLSVIAANASGPSASSHPVTLTFPGACTGVPAAPVNFQAWRAGSTIYVSWSPPASGPAVTRYTVQVGGAFVGGFTTPGRTLSGLAAPGTYTLSVVGENVCGTGVATPEQTVVIP